ncbi:MAG: hypothetical protein NC087_05365 [Anaeroplasma bactoclasticum]|nr:hypothetical protein [Anaeroplasma bactoclasticum]
MRMPYDEESATEREERMAREARQRSREESERRRKAIERDAQDRRETMAAMREHYRTMSQVGDIRSASDLEFEREQLIKKEQLARAQALTPEQLEELKAEREAELIRQKEELEQRQVKDGIIAALPDAKKRAKLRESAAETRVINGREYYRIDFRYGSCWLTMPDALVASPVWDDASYKQAHINDNEVLGDDMDSSAVLLGGYTPTLSSSGQLLSLSMPSITMDKLTYEVNDVVVLREVKFDRFGNPYIDENSRTVVATSDLASMIVVDRTDTNTKRLNGDLKTYRTTQTVFTDSGIDVTQEIRELEKGTLVKTVDYKKPRYFDEYTKTQSKNNQQKLKKEREEKREKAKFEETRTRHRETIAQARSKVKEKQVPTDAFVEKLIASAEEHHFIDGDLYLKIKNEDSKQFEWYVYELPTLEDNARDGKERLGIGGISRESQHAKIEIDREAYEKGNKVVLRKVDMTGIEFDKQGGMIVDADKDAQSIEPYGPKIDYSAAYVYTTALKPVAKLSAWLASTCYITDDWSCYVLPKVHGLDGRLLGFSYFDLSTGEVKREVDENGHDITPKKTTK